MLRVVRGDATDEELAALVTALAAARRSAPAPQPAPSRWADRAAQIGAALAPGPGAWLAGAWHHRPRHR
ncbi:Acyl-CoA carboxylase epsilon subunit [Quadrisphaera sp. DSM 44207]|nr:Acyl-CoA carboxylase epsilon subunit [Quadrisphaera sp. DSM 44207]